MCLSLSTSVNPPSVYHWALCRPIPSWKLGLDKLTIFFSYSVFCTINTTITDDATLTRIKLLPTGLFKSNHRVTLLTSDRPLPCVVLTSWYNPPTPDITTWVWESHKNQKWVIIISSPGLIMCYYIMAPILVLSTPPSTRGKLYEDYP